MDIVEIAKKHHTNSKTAAGKTYYEECCQCGWSKLLFLAIPIERTPCLSTECYEHFDPEHL